MSVSKLNTVLDCTLSLEGGQKSFGAIEHLIQLLPAPWALLCYELQLPQSQELYVDQVDICQGHLLYLLRHVCSTEGHQVAMWVAKVTSMQLSGRGCALAAVPGPVPAACLGQPHLFLGVSVPAGPPLCQPHSHGLS